MSKIIHLNRDWEFTENYSERFQSGAAADEMIVDLPHTCKETPFNYFDESVYQMVCGYRKKLRLSKEDASKRAFLVIDAAAHYSEVYADSKLICSHRGGYTRFEAELTDHLSPGRDTLIVIKIDSRESLDFPPFGNVIDYMTYGGLYREVRLELRENSFIKDVFAKPSVTGDIAGDFLSKSFIGVIDSDIEIENPDDTKIRQTILSKGGEKLVEKTFEKGEAFLIKAENIKLWDVDSPTLYTLKTELIRSGYVIDEKTVSIGFRRAQFKKDGFYLNGRKLKITGLNRHQSFPYVGYAMPRSMQRYDAELMKYELSLNAVRTSHYPQSQHFIDRCDEIGLLVFTEIPGWQHIGGKEWKDTAVESVREMVTQYRNHPSVILWGVRINESLDDDEFYTRTNAEAHKLDPTRPTGGVRCYKKSSLLEDVYTYNDFSHSGENGGCLKKSAVTSDMNKPYLITEYNGHMYPAKAYDDDDHRLNHALRHARVLDSVAQNEDIAGSFGWCFFDYNTHMDFGSGDRVCYHGVCDMFRNRKLAAFIYSSIGDNEPILEISSSMDNGDHPESNHGRVYIFTNADSVRMYINDSFIKEYYPENKDYQNLHRPPIEIDDYIGDRIAENESYSLKQARLIKDVLNENTIAGAAHQSLKTKLRSAWLGARYHLSQKEANTLYGKYIGNWGDKAVVYRFEAIKNGEVVKTVFKSPFAHKKLSATLSHTELSDAETYDVAAIRLRMTDQNDNTLSYFSGIIDVKLQGPIKLIGADRIALSGGMGGAYIKTTGEEGKATVTLTCDGIELVALELTVSSGKKASAAK